MPIKNQVKKLKNEHIYNHDGIKRHGCLVSNDSNHCYDSHGE